MYEDRDEWEEILQLPQGIFRVRYHKMTIKALKNRRSRLQSQMNLTRQKIGSLQLQINALYDELRTKEENLRYITNIDIESYIASEKERQKEIEDKANALLCDLIGQENFERLQKQGDYIFKGLDGETYRIKNNAELQQLINGYWHHCCVIKPQNLPLPDFIASIITATKNDPIFLSQSRRSRTHEEVTQG